MRRSPVKKVRKITAPAPAPARGRVIPDDGDRVTVACKFPMGLVLRVFEMVDVEEPGPAGARTVKKARQIGGPENVVRINGYNTDGIHLVGGVVSAGFALTHDVPRAFFDLWLEQNADCDLVQNGLIFAHRQPASVRDQVRDHEAERCGLEPLEPTPPGNPWGPPPKATDPRLRRVGAVTTMQKD